MKCEVLGKEEDNVFVVIGNDYGFQEAHKLVLEMAAEKDIPIQIEMVSKAGKSVWSVAKQDGWSRVPRSESSKVCSDMSMQPSLISNKQRIACQYKRGSKLAL